MYERISVDRLQIVTSNKLLVVCLNIQISIVKGTFNVIFAVSYLKVKQIIH